VKGPDGVFVETPNIGLEAKGDPFESTSGTA
jgi:hypothetical protein